MNKQFENGHQLEFNDLKDLGCRVFDPRVTMGQITDNLNEKGLLRFLSWGVEKKIGVISNDEDETIGMMLKLNHKNYDELVYITLNFLDYYNIYFIRMNDNELLNKVEDVGCEELFITIDSLLESVIKFEINPN
jgi:hypothetical protein